MCDFRLVHQKVSALIHAALESKEVGVEVAAGQTEVGNL
jgi:hypothetical protein